MHELPPNVDSRFRYVLLIAKRAEQLVQGAASKVRSRHSKPTRVAMDEVDNEKINWRLSPPAAPVADEMPEEVEAE